MADTLRSPRNPGHRYQIRELGSEGHVLVPEGIDSVVIINGDGALLISAQDANADALRLRPRFPETLSDIARAAAIRWQLDSGEQHEGING